ncbi:hypothetical protein EV210_10123 [Anaerospora hongkongensis]|uniref:Uncharacterized protein n=1 Tax=Anaerospora hongkongensis TaxID=244830 RepID=A0A4R1Q2X7_9FIRM|nr:hypothetical protein [Anaerospora hongkongensis]TCL39828.1 hypothetical protein EV210_10123 [Anaerospora hongkongensis]
MNRQFFLQAIVFSILFMLFSAHAFAGTAAGTVVYVRENFYVVETDRGYSVMEWYQEKDPEEGDKVSGTFDHPGLQQLYNETAKREFKVWIYDYWLTEEKAHEVLKQRGVKEWRAPFRHD